MMSSEMVFLFFLNLFIVFFVLTLLVMAVIVVENAKSLGVLCNYQYDNS